MLLEKRVLTDPSTQAELFVTIRSTRAHQRFPRDVPQHLQLRSSNALDRIRPFHTLHDAGGHRRYDHVSPEWRIL